MCAVSFFKGLANGFLPVATETSTSSPDTSLDQATAPSTGMRSIREQMGQRLGITAMPEMPSQLLMSAPSNALWQRHLSGEQFSGAEQLQFQAVSDALNSSADKWFGLGAQLAYRDPSTLHPTEQLALNIYNGAVNHIIGEPLSPRESAAMALFYGAANSAALVTAGARSSTGTSSMTQLDTDDLRAEMLSFVSSKS